VHANAAQQEIAHRRAAAVLPYLDAAKGAVGVTLAHLAEALMARGVPASDQPRAGKALS
jgi:hypothetical protein